MTIAPPRVFAEGLKDLNVTSAPNPTIVEPPEQSAQKERKESVAGGLLRRLSTRRHQNRDVSDRGEREPREKGGVSHPPSSLAAPWACLVVPVVLD